MSSVIRFLLSLADCTQCIVLDDHLTVLPISSHSLSLAPVLPKVCSCSKFPQYRSAASLLALFSAVHGCDVLLFHCQVEEEVTGLQKELQLLKESLSNTQPIGHLVGCCRTLDQASFGLSFLVHPAMLPSLPLHSLLSLLQSCPYSMLS